jgi:hypothetical protein
MVSSRKVLILKVGATGIEPMTSTVSSTVQPTPDQRFSVLGCARLCKTTRENWNSAPWVHPQKDGLPPDATREEGRQNTGRLEVNCGREKVRAAWAR